MVNLGLRRIFTEKLEECCLKLLKEQKKIDRKSKQKVGAHDEFMIQENIHRKTRRTLPKVGERTKIAERKSKQNLSTDDEFRI